VIKLADFDSPFGPITILRAKTTGAVIYEQAGNFQSECDSNGISLVAYIHALYALICEAKAHSVLVIGGGGGTLGTMLARNGHNVTMVDVNPASFPLARVYFNLPDSVHCVVADGREFLLSHARCHDAIVLDAYHGDRIPAHLQSLAFFRLVASRLAGHGVVLANVHVANDADIAAERMADCMANVWPGVRLLDTKGLNGRNAIVLAGAVARLNKPSLLITPAAEANVIDAELAKMDFTR